VDCQLDGPAPSVGKEGPAMGLDGMGGGRIGWSGEAVDRGRAGRLRELEGESGDADRLARLAGVGFIPEACQPERERLTDRRGMESSTHCQLEELDRRPITTSSFLPASFPQARSPASAPLVSSPTVVKYTCAVTVVSNTFIEPAMHPRCVQQVRFAPDFRLNRHSHRD